MGGRHPSDDSLQVKKRTYVRTGTPKVMAKAPGGPRNSYDVVLGLREAVSERDMMVVPSYGSRCVKRVTESASPSRVCISKSRPRPEQGIDPLLLFSSPRPALCAGARFYLWDSSLHDGTTPIQFQALLLLNRRGVLPHQESSAPDLYVRTSIFVSCVLI